MRDEAREAFLEAVKILSAEPDLGGFVLVVLDEEGAPRWEQYTRVGFGNALVRAAVAATAAVAVVAGRSASGGE